MQILKCQMHLPTANVYVLVLSATWLQKPWVAWFCLFMTRCLWTLGCNFETSQVGILKPHLLTLPAIFSRGHWVKAGFLQLENVGTYEWFLPLSCRHGLSSPFHGAKSRVRQTRSWDVQYKEAWTFRATPLTFCALVACLPHPRF